ncbi:riboflavin synthase domain-like protein [Linderina pennispora]|uniref:Riboflavin synthase domain-like protein n=1 Tax=Linderina pennispora TaxID=61395 RepID=A0A1Y1W1L6_9FUNG|nr:riboflavin synthase domain-like protein [Linderina pennispora]ORX67433.1 riboflavin synthase domain-like protein [Linderina pennispora]
MADTSRRLLILYGSQTGYAEDVARRISRQAWRRHFTTEVLAMDEADRSLLFLCAPPQGQGEEPDNMKKFWRYRKFNFPAKRLFRRLLQLGGTPVVPRGDGDDQHYLGTDGALDPWLEELWEELLLTYPMPQPIIPDSVTPDPTFDISFVDCDRARRRILPRLTHAERITAEEHFQDVRHFRFELSEPAQWSPGDCLVVRPSNQAKDVEEFLEAAMVPRRSFFELMAYFGGSADETEKLQEFASTQGQDDLHTYCMRPRRTIIEALGDFPKTRLPLSHVMDIVPSIAERSFSISSAAAVTPRAVDLTVAIVDYKTMMYKRRVGLCTQWLKHMPYRHTCAHLETPVIMVGPGTGIAAFMAFIRHRQHQGATANYLFFGYYFYREELESLQSDGALHLFCAFSRDPGPQGNAATLWPLISEMGADRMPDDVRRAFVDVVKEQGQVDESEAELFIDSMVKTRQYQEECWE